MSPDRLAELRRQRSVIAEHLAWLDREIAAASPTTAPAATPLKLAVAKPGQPILAPIPAAAVTPDPASILAAASAPAPAPFPAADAVPDEHAHLLPEAQPADIKNDVRRGCFLYLAIATLLVVGGCALLYWASQQYKKSHPPPPPQERLEQ